MLGKVYEMKGMNREAADAYLTPLIYAQGQTPFTGLKMVYSDFCSLCCTLSRQISRFRISNPGLIYARQYLLLSFCMFLLDNMLRQFICRIIFIT